MRAGCVQKQRHGRHPLRGGRGAPPHVVLPQVALMPGRTQTWSLWSPTQIAEPPAEGSSWQLLVTKEAF